MSKSKNKQDLPESNEIGFYLEENKFKFNEKQPFYAGTITFDERKIIEANKKYAYGAWVTDDNSIYVKIQPFENIKKRQQKRISQVPKHIRDVINNMDFDNESD